MGFRNVLMPDTLSWGFTGGPGFKTDIITTDSGHEERVQRWDSARWQWRATRIQIDDDDAHELKEFYLTLAGAAYGFRFKDWSDYTTNPNDGKAAPTNLDQYLGDADGVETQFQLAKNYTFGGNTYRRVITHPVDSTTVVAVGGTPQASGWTVDTTTGVITFSVAPVTGQVTAGCQFDVPVRLGITMDRGFDLSMEAFNLNSLLDIPLIEILDEGDNPETFQAGGGFFYQPTADWTLSLAKARVWTVNPLASGLSGILPEPINYGSGGVYFYMINESTSNTYDVLDSAGGTVATVAVKVGAVRGVAQVLLIDNLSGTKTWISFS